MGFYLFFCLYSLIARATPKGHVDAEKWIRWLVTTSLMDWKNPQAKKDHNILGGYIMLWVFKSNLSSDIVK